MPKTEIDLNQLYKVDRQSTIEAIVEEAYSFAIVSTVGKMRYSPRDRKNQIDQRCRPFTRISVA